MDSVDGDPAISPVKHPSDNIEDANSNGSTIQHETEGDAVNSSRQHSTIHTNSSFSPRTNEMINEHNSTLNEKQRQDMIIVNRNAGKDYFCMKQKKSKANSKNVIIDPQECQYAECISTNVDLIRCNICQKFVCEVCNDVAVAKLKPIMNKCDTIYFLCKECNGMSQKEIEKVNEKSVPVDNDLITEGVSRVIASMEKAQKSLNDLVDDKDELIESQKAIIQGFRNNSNLDTTAADLKEVREIMAIKQAELSSCQVQLKTQEKLTASKVDLIENLKLMISQLNLSPSCTSSSKGEDNLTSEAESTSDKQDGENEDIPGMEECMLCLSGIAIHGVVLDGLLLWADTQRRTIASDLWKNEAEKHFTPEEITSAKNRLWEVCDENVIGKLVKRQGQSKQQSEIDDIANALEKLAEKKIMPVFVATSNMVMQTPKSSANIASFQNIEEMVDSAIKKRTDLSDKKHDRAISKTEFGNKKIEEVLKRLESLERNIKKPNMDGGNFAQANIPPVKPILWNPRTGASISRNQPNDGTNNMAGNIQRIPLQPPLTVNYQNHENQPNNGTNSMTENMQQIPPRAPPTLNNQDKRNHINNASIARESVPVANTTQFVPTWAEITQEGKKRDVSDNHQEPRSWRQKLHLLNGVAGEVTPGGSFSADIDIVAYNVSKSISSTDLRYWLSQNGLTIKDCKLLTTAEGARSLSYRITIDPKDYQKATTDASLWPYRVGVRLFKHFNNTRNDTERQRNNNVYSENTRHNDRRSGFQDNGRTAGSENDHRFNDRENRY